MFTLMTRHIASHRVWLPAILVAAITAGTALPASAATTFKIDIDSTYGGSDLETALGFTSLLATNQTGSATIDGVTFTESGSKGDRNRSGGSDLVTDFIFNDDGGVAGDVGLKISGLQEGIWEASIWSFDSATGVSNQNAGVKSDDGSDRQLFVTGFNASTSPVTFQFNTANFDDDFIIFVSGGAGRARFNGLELTTLIPEPASVALVGLGGVILLSRRWQ